MRWTIRIGAALAVLLLLALAGLAVALPRLARSDAVRARIEAAAREATGQPLAWEELSFGLLPPRLVVASPRLGGEGGGEPVVAAERVDLRVALLPLLARTLVIDSLRIDGVTVRLVRTKDGIELPGITPPAAGGAKAPGAEGAPSAAEQAGGGLALAVRELELTNSHLVLVDRTVKPPVTWDIEELDARARGDALDAPVDLTIDGKLAGGGRVRVEGRAGLDATLDLQVRLDGVALGPIAPYLPDAKKLAGRLSGTLAVRGPAAAPESVKADLTLEDGDVAIEDVVLRGRLAVKADVSGGPGALAGPFEVDATDAELVYGQAFQKPRGTTATATGRLVPDEGGALGVTDLRVRMKNLDATGRLSSGRALRLEIEASPFDLDGWEALLPALTELRPTGRMAFEKLTVVSEPMAVRGRIVLAGVALRRADVPEPIELTGALVGEGDRLRSEGLEVRVGGQPVATELTVAGLSTAPRYHVTVATKEADADRLAAALAGRPGVVEGPVTFDADLSGPLAGDVVRTMAGRAQLAMGQGRLHGVSLLRSTFERLGAFGEAALIAGALRGGRTLQRFYQDEFESITGSFAIGRGLARTDDLRLVYRHYVAELRGSLGLADGSLDFAGRLVISEEIDAALAQAAAEAGAPPPEPREKVIPLARVRGTVTDPRIDLSPQAVLAFASSFAVARRREQVEKKLDEALGEGTGKQVIDVLEGILGGGRRPSGQ